MNQLASWLVCYSFDRSCSICLDKTKVRKTESPKCLKGQYRLVCFIGGSNLSVLCRQLDGRLIVFGTLNLGHSSSRWKRWSRGVGYDLPQNVSPPKTPGPPTQHRQASDVALYLKDESAHTCGSLKYRSARLLFLYGIANGWIYEQRTVIEASSGSTAIAEAYFAASFAWRLLR